MMTKFVLVVCAVFLGWADTAGAQSSIPLDVKPQVTRGQMLDGKTYAIDITCQKSDDLHNAIDHNPFFTNTRTHGLLISTVPPTTAPAGADKLPDNTLAAVQVFSVDKDTTFVDRTNCDHHFLVAGGKRYYLVGFINILSDFAGSQAGTILTNLAGLVTPLFTLFTGNPLPAAIATRITNLQPTVNPLQNIITAFNRGKNWTKIVDNLRIGTYIVKTDYSIVTVNVRLLPSIVLDDNSAFRKDFRDQINAAPEKIDIANIEQSCQGVRGGLTESSITSRTDISYGLIALAARAKFNQEQVIRCLTRDYTPSAIAIPDAAWVFPDELRFDQDAVDRLLPVNAWPPQPTFAVIKPKLDQLVVSLAQYARNKPAPDVAVKRLSELMAANVAIIDKTSDLRITGSIDPIERLKAIDTLISKGYIRFGCYAESTDATDRSVDGAVAMLLTFNAPSDAPSTTVDKALVVRPLYSKLILTTLIVSINTKYATTVLNDRGYDCNGFTVEKPKTPSG